MEGWRRVPFDAPLARTREYIEIIRGALAGGAVNHQGEFYQMERFRMTSPSVQERLPIYIASLGPKNLSLTGEVSDGRLPVWLNRERVPDLKELVSAGAARSDKMLDRVAVSGDPQQCRDQLAKFRQAGVDMPVATFLHGTDLEAIHRTIDALAP